VFGHLRRATGGREPQVSKEFGRAAERWTRVAVGMRVEADGRLRFPTWKKIEGRHELDPSFLTGDAGVALLLLHADSGRPPGWAAPLLVS